MPAVEFDSETKSVVLVLVDLSGYTKFLTGHDTKALRHSQMIVRELLETLMRQVEVPLKVVEVEGDALFLYAERSSDDRVWGRRSRHVVERLLAMFGQFRERLMEIGAFSVCMCEACAATGDLDLKIIIHTGEVAVGRIGDREKLTGVDVITLHRLAKNSMSGDRYVLMTEPAFTELGAPDDVEITEGVERYDTGEVRTFSFVPDVTVSVDESAILERFSNDNVAVQILRDEIAREYTDVATEPERGYHFNTGWAAAEMLGYEVSWLEGVPEEILLSFAGTGNPFTLGPIEAGDYVVDVGSGSGTDAVIAANMVGLEGHVIGVDMTDAMRSKALASVDGLGLAQLEFREGFMESLPVPDCWADVVISNGVINLSPYKQRVFEEMFRVLRPGGRLLIADIAVDRPIPEEAKRDIDLWTN